MRRSISSLAVASVVLLVIALTFAGAVGAENGGVPFEASYSGACVVTPGFPILHVACAASGNATHLGKSSVTVSLSENLLATPCPTSVGTGTLTAANGDQFFITTSGTACGGTSGVVVVGGTQTVIGGTGRFEGASGSFTVAGTVNTSTGAISYTFDGSISY
jgi:hypothetical protein